MGIGRGRLPATLSRETMWAGRAGHISGGKDRRNLQLVDKQPPGASEEDCDYSQQYCAINCKVAKRPDLNCAQHKKETIIV